MSTLLLHRLPLRDMLMADDGAVEMRICMIAIAMIGLPAVPRAQLGPVTRSAIAASMHTNAGPRYVTVRIPSGAMLPRREVVSPPARKDGREYRIEPSSYPDRSAHVRALDEMNAINNRRPREFRFQPVMALTFDPAQLKEPAMTGIAPMLMGAKRAR